MEHIVYNQMAFCQMLSMVLVDIAPVTHLVETVHDLLMLLTRVNNSML